MKKPIMHDIWSEGKGHKSEIYDIERMAKIFKHHYGVVSGNIVQIGGGSSGGGWSLVLKELADNLKVIDYSPKMMDIIKNTFTINSVSTDNVEFIVERMENYVDPDNADYVIFTYSMSFSNIAQTIHNLDNNYKKGCKVIISETLKPLIYEIYTDMSEDKKKRMKKWKTNLLRIERYFSGNEKWRLDKKEILKTKSVIPSMFLHYTKILN